MFITTFDLISRRTRLLSSLIRSFKSTFLLCFKHCAQCEAIVGEKRQRYFHFTLAVKLGTYLITLLYLDFGLVF